MLFIYSTEDEMKLASLSVADLSEYMLIDMVSRAMNVKPRIIHAVGVAISVKGVRYVPVNPERVKDLMEGGLLYCSN